MMLCLVSHPLCPYVQRAVIALTEKGVPFQRIDIDLAAKPAWFLALSPLGKTPVLLSGGRPIFESAVILESLEETQPNPLHPADPLARARARGWIEMASQCLNGIAALYNAPDATALEAAAATLRGRFTQVEAAFGNGPWFDGTRFSLVDASFGPVFRYFDTFDRIGDFSILTGLPCLARWRTALAARRSVAGAVGSDYDARLLAFIARRNGHLARLAATEIAS
jgi:glutathione S-transferase